jgi:hypothetical protein
MATLRSSQIYGNLSVTGSAEIVGTLTLGTGSTLLTNSDGTIKGSALESSIAGTGLSLTTGVLSHATGAGYNHIPTGGSSNQILRWSSSGVAQWSDESTGGIDLSPSLNAFIVGTADDWTVKTGSDVRTAAGLGTSNSVQFTSLTLSSNLTVGGNAGVTGTATVAALSCTGDATLGGTTGNRTIIIDKGTSSNTYLNFRSGGSRRWQINVNEDTTSSFIINECDVSTGNVIDDAFSILRADGGSIKLNRNVNIVKDFITNGLWWDSTSKVLEFDTRGMTFSLSESKVAPTTSPSVWLQSTNTGFGGMDHGIISIGAKRATGTTGFQEIYLMGILAEADDTAGKSLVRVHKPGTTEPGNVEPTFSIDAHYGNYISYGGAVINENGLSGDLGDTRIESSGNPNMVFVDSDNNRVGIGNGSPEEQLDQSGHIRTSGAGTSGVINGHSSVNVSFSANFNGTPIVVCTPNWNTTCWISSVSPTGFTANFGTAASYGAVIYYHAFRRYGD